MLVKNMTEFRKSMKETLDDITENEETVIISRTDDRDVVVLSLKVYNGIRETLYLMSSQANHDRLSKAISDTNENKNMIQKSLLF